MSLLLVCSSLFVVPNRCGSGTPAQNQRHQLRGKPQVSWRAAPTRWDQMGKTANVWGKNTAERTLMLREHEILSSGLLWEKQQVLSIKERSSLMPWIICLKFIEICFSWTILWNFPVIHNGLSMMERGDVRTEPFFFVWLAFYIMFSHPPLLPSLTSLPWKLVFQHWSVWRLHPEGHTYPVEDI